jgi:CheY-like chemotaxis protein/sRNA-binding carbon storage regulator CsrA
MNERITFPALGITIHILRLTGRSARLGVDAPPEIRIYRDEISPSDSASDPNQQNLCGTSVTIDHALANALSKITLAVHLARKQWAAGRGQDADRTLAMALESLAGLEQSVERAPAKPNPRPAAPGTSRALIVEDDANERELLAGVLGMSGCECATAADGEEALTYLESGARPDVVLLDMSMPRCDGPETLRRIRADERFAGLCVFSVSSTNPKAFNVPEGPAGFNAWFPKPLNPRGLWDAIQSTVRAPASVN